MNSLSNKIQEFKKAYNYSDIDSGVVLAYSGGIDTSAIAKLIQDELNTDVYTVNVELGQETDVQAIKEKALNVVGVKKHFSIDSKEEFVKDYIYPAIKANGLYQGVYANSTALGRPLIAKYLVKVAQEVGAKWVAHGSTGKGNDQVRFDLGVKTLDPNLKVLAPIRDWNMYRDETIAYLNEKNIPASYKTSKFSVDENIWGRSVECGELELPNHEPPADAFLWVSLEELASDDAGYVNIHFEKGEPIAVDFPDFTIKDPVQMVLTMREFIGSHGYGIVDHMEDRVVGLKSREFYETPSALTFIKAHHDLEKFVFSKEENEFKPIIDKTFSELVYKGLWYSPLMQSVQSFINTSQEYVTGSVKVKTYKGSQRVVSRDSPYALYDHALATYDQGSTWNQLDSPGFINLFGMSTIMATKVRSGVLNNKTEKEPEVQKITVNTSV